MVLQIEPFDCKQHNRSKFSCGVESLDRYIRSQANQDLKKKIATVFVLIDAPDTNIMAYYTLSSYTVEITEIDNSLAKRLPRYPLLPATLLGRLAVDNRYRGQHLEELILVDALKKSLEATEKVASLAVIAEAIDEKAVYFYRKYGFRSFVNSPMKLYFPMQSIRELCQSLNI
ncbi:acetyltransferase (plasmid) [Stanieria cyanosphaera PCC 7437]|uniref:Acetyltransferase n=1 Tax=Stanieria cyanosphaera (strain ATCC 29371 / PCC 7437) TaxID=111780 RepID=K9XZQ3_STAC7|nr:GNAT family N-acetyltransferase [Stanieria cyanosphaera]AFZ38013.1 acetyltransferase [Stanieria cyanosphaera PCC 7437]